MKSEDPICTVSSFTNDDGRFIELRDRKGVKCIYRADEDETDVSIMVDKSGQVVYAHIGDAYAEPDDDEVL